MFINQVWYQMRRNRPQVTEIYQSAVSTDGFYKKQKSNNPKDSYQLFVQWDSTIFQIHQESHYETKWQDWIMINDYDHKNV